MRRRAGTRWRTGATAPRAARRSRRRSIHTSSIAGYSELRPGQLLGGEAGGGRALPGHPAGGARYGVRSNVISPSARTRLTGGAPAPSTPGFDPRDPANVSPLVAWLAPPSARRTASTSRSTEVGCSSCACRRSCTTCRTPPGAGPWRISIASSPRGWSVIPPWTRCSRICADARRARRDGQGARSAQRAGTIRAVSRRGGGDDRVCAGDQRRRSGASRRPVASPLFAVVPALKTLVRAKRLATEAFTLHGEHDITFHRPIVPGMTLDGGGEARGRTRDARRDDVDHPRHHARRRRSPGERAVSRQHRPWAPPRRGRGRSGA